MKKAILLPICVSFVLVRPVMLAGEENKAPEPPSAPLRLSVDEMMALHEKNLAASDREFANRQVELTGVFDSVWRVSVANGGVNEYGIHLMPSERGSKFRVFCAFKREDSKPLASLEPGQVATVRGICRIASNGSSPLEMEDCRLVKATGLPKISANRQRWEYKLVGVEYKQGGESAAIATVNEKLNEMAADGWEYIERVPELSRNRGHDPFTICLIFKRVKSK